MKEYFMHANDVRTIPLFETVSRTRRGEVARLADRITVPAETVLVRQGELGHEFFVIVDGVADVVRDDRLVATLGPGDFFGEIALVGTPFRTATVVARSELDLAVVPRREFRALLSRFPGVASAVLCAGRARVVSTLREVEAMA
jgi:CRP/FNR family cyclic AMP-dependent transcriptional regulator